MEFVIRTRCRGLVGAMIPDRRCCPGRAGSGWSREP